MLEPARALPFACGLPPYRTTARLADPLRKLFARGQTLVCDALSLRLEKLPDIRRRQRQTLVQNHPKLGPGLHYRLMTFREHGTGSTSPPPNNAPIPAPLPPPAIAPIKAPAAAPPPMKTTFRLVADPPSRRLRYPS